MTATELANDEVFASFCKTRGANPMSVANFIWSKSYYSTIKD